MSDRSKKSIGVFSLVMINFAAIANVRTLPSVAPYGLSMLFFYSLATLCFLIPSALVSAELASSFPGEGGVYHWASKALGSRVGFLAAWLQNSNNFICFPTALSFIASTLAYGIFPGLAENKTFTLSIILVVIWVGTFLTLNGVQLTGWISAIGGVIGTLIPVIIMVAIGSLWIVSKRPVQMEISSFALVPNLSKAGNMSLFLGVLLGFAGLEMSANHVQDVEDPQRKYPKAILISAFLIFSVSVLGSLAIAIVLPKSEITMNGGAIQTISRFFSETNFPYAAPILSCMMVIGSLAWFCAWVSGPPRALYVAANCGNLPKFFRKLNRHNMPTNIMLTQAVLSSILSGMFILAESVNAAFWILTVMTAQFLLLMYAFMFLAAIVLKFKLPEVPRLFQIPFGKIGMCLVSGIGLLICITFYVIGFFPPHDMVIKDPVLYVAFLILGNFIIGILPSFLFRSREG